MVWMSWRARRKGSRATCACMFFYIPPKKEQVVVVVGAVDESNGAQSGAMGAVGLGVAGWGQARGWVGDGPGIVCRWSVEVTGALTAQEQIARRSFSPPPRDLRRLCGSL